MQMLVTTNLMNIFKYTCYYLLNRLVKEMQIGTAGKIGKLNPWLQVVYCVIKNVFSFHANVPFCMRFGKDTKETYSYL